MVAAAKAASYSFAYARSMRASRMLFLIAVFSVVVCHSFSNRLMFVLFVDVLVVVVMCLPWVMC